MIINYHYYNYRMYLSRSNLVPDGLMDSTNLDLHVDVLTRHPEVWGCFLDCGIKYVRRSKGSRRNDSCFVSCVPFDRFIHTHGNDEKCSGQHDINESFFTLIMNIIPMELIQWTFQLFLTNDSLIQWNKAFLNAFVFHLWLIWFLLSISDSSSSSSSSLIPDTSSSSSSSLGKFTVTNSFTFQVKCTVLMSMA